MRTARLVKRHARYELHVVFAGMVPAAVIAPHRWLGIDRGVVNIAAAADDQGTVVWTSGNALEGLERRLRRQREGAQRRGAAASMRAAQVGFRAAARNEINRIAKHIVGLAVRLHARVSAEDLTAFARGDARILARAQYANLLAAIEAGLERWGYAPLARGGKRVWQVRAAGTSQCCALCGHTEAANRPTRDVFRCMTCGYAANADVNAALNIARRGHETNAARQGRVGRAVGLGASASGVVARPATAVGDVAPAGGAKCL